MEKTNILSGIKKTVKGFCTAIFAAAAGVCISGAFAAVTSMKLESAPLVIMAFVTVGAFVNGACAASAIGKKGLVVGTAAGLFYTACIITCMSLVSGCTDIMSARLALFAFPVAASAAAGILAVGRKS